ncbi:MAG: hypothetical protein AABP62_19350 [Planctomycetota bacterium]
MAMGSLIDGSGQLKAACDQLEETWAAAREGWHDAVSRSLEDEHLEPLFTQVRTTLDAIARLNGVLVTACRQCQDRE